MNCTHPEWIYRNTENGIVKVCIKCETPLLLPKNVQEDIDKAGWTLAAFSGSVSDEYVKELMIQALNGSIKCEQPIKNDPLPELP